ncbi:MAG TPA: ABC transporter ATP-binding protein [Thermoanaerobaculia bacterium]|nr:ABC transporter ATP-binding protein [Thermoanaerobaculia bacterium]
MTGVRIRGLRKSFRSLTRRTHVLQGVDLDVEPGQVVGLIGPNGAGKTTLMSCLLGFLHADSGEVSIDGRPADDIDVRRRIGFVPERMNFGRRATSQAFLRYMARLSKADVARVEALLSKLDVAHGARKRLSEHSRGMLQRVGMAQALLGEPDYLFLDEPASGLDPNGVLLVRDLILEQKERGRAVLLNSHQLSEVEKVCDRVYFLDRGVIGREETLRHDTTIPIAITLLDGQTVELDVGSEEEIAAVVGRMVGEGARIIEVRRRTADLEGMFRSGR